jgi:hypothetical protein
VQEGISTLTKGNQTLSMEEGRNMRVFVKNMRGEPLMPCSPRKARLLLKQSQANIIDYKPFTIQLTMATGETVQETDLGFDLGAKHIGVALQSENHVLAKGEIELRQDISSLLETRKILRRSRRNRKTRYRRCKFKVKTKRVYDEKKGKWVKKKVLLESSRPEGWLPPSIESRMNNTFFWIDQFTLLVPKPTVHLEVGKFDVQKMMKIQTFTGMNIKKERPLDIMMFATLSLPVTITPVKCVRKKKKSFIHTTLFIEVIVVPTEQVIL